MKNSLAILLMIAGSGCVPPGAAPRATSTSATACGNVEVVLQSVDPNTGEVEGSVTTDSGGMSAGPLELEVSIDGASVGAVTAIATSTVTGATDTREFTFQIPATYRDGDEHTMSFALPSGAGVEPDAGTDGGTSTATAAS